MATLVWNACNVQAIKQVDPGVVVCVRFKVQPGITYGSIQPDNSAQ